jgi:hypothetical protein
MPKSRKLRPSSTPGRSKNENCQKSQTKNKYAKDTRWYKKDVINYAKACEHINNQKGNQKSGWIDRAMKGLPTIGLDEIQRELLSAVDTADKMLSAD